MIFLFDTETTDLVHNTLLPLQQQPRIIEFYGVLLDKYLNRVNEIEFLCDPGIPISEEVTKITGIKNEDVAGLRRFSEHAGSVVEMLSSADEWVAHNLSYDEFVVEVELKRAGIVMPVPKSKVCTVEATEWIKGYRLKLGDLYEHLFEEPMGEAHRARNDVEAMVKCFCKLRQQGDI